MTRALDIARALPAPGLVWGSYPEERAARACPPWWLASIEAACGRLRPARRLPARLAAVHAENPGPFPLRLEALRRKLAGGRLSDTLLAESFALIDLACRRELGLAAYDNQLAAARLLLDNYVVEMATGEGKTLAALFAAATAALAGVPVHVITANDYLAARDAGALARVYAALGLRTAAVHHAMGTEERRRAYGCEVTYCSAKELVFDYLRDSLARRAQGGELERRAERLAAPSEAAAGVVLRGLCMAIVDEADSILIDEARVPFVLSQSLEGGGERGFYAHALDLARGLEAPRDFQIQSHGIELSAAGRRSLAAFPGKGALQRDARYLEETVSLALNALHVLRKDRDYLVRGGRVLIVEPTTGRAVPGRAWARGLQQLVELKEGIAPSARPATLAQISYQRFFPRYLRLCGMSGTVREAGAEMLAVYGCRVARVPNRRPCRRRVYPARLFASGEARWSAVLERVAEMHRAGRPVLIGTASVAESEALSRRLAAAGLAHGVLNARHDLEEAAIVAAAGERGRITVATNMAGRGTDIALGEEVAQLGGLHVILCQHNASRRVDRQFLGRCARRGEPGSCEILLALEDLPERHWGARLLKRLYRGDRTVPRWLAHALARLAAWQEELRHCAQRRRLREADAQAERLLPAHRQHRPMEPAHAR